MKITVIGLGYIGLPTALLLSKTRHDVLGFDINYDLIERLNSGNLNELDDEIRGFFDDDSSVEFKHEIEKSDMYIICVPTPVDKISKKFDSQPLIIALNNIISIANKESIIVIESTIPPGTIDKIVLPMLVDSQITKVAHCPERVMPGNMKYELVQNSRIIGTNDYETGLVLKSLYSSFTKGDIIITSNLIAELSKVIENSYRDVNIAFANSIAMICAGLKVDSKELISIANLHPRVDILKPGPGVGGHCIPVDPWFLISDFPNETGLLLKAREINDYMPNNVVSRVFEIVQTEGIELSRVGFYGLSYKANIKDYRESPSFKVISDFNERSAIKPHIFEPHQFANSSELEEKFNSFIKKIDLLVILVDHEHLFHCKEIIQSKLIFDTKSISYLEAKYRL